MFASKPSPKLSQALDILRCILPWALESNSTKSLYRKNYKGTRGRIGIVGGARDYAGAPYFASISSMRLGADLSYVICSKNAAQAIKNYSPDLIVMPLLDSDEDEFNSEINCLFDRLHALVIGPGLGREKLLQDRAKKLIEMAKLRKLPLVLDADSLILINENPKIIKSYSKAMLTPNRVELQRLFNSLFAPKSYDLRNMSTNDISDLVQECSKVLDVSILAKGSVDIISQPCGFLLTTDELSGSNRRCGGQGDILSGLAGVYFHWICQFNKESDNKITNEIAWSAYLAAITTRLTNEIAYKDFKNGMLASHMIEKVSVALDTMLKQVTNNNYNNETSGSKVVKLSNVEYSGTLNQDDIKRYDRQMIMEEFGPERQVNLKKSSAIIIGAGGLGCPSSLYLAAVGIGRIGIVDDDRVELSNLHRQILHNVNKVGMLKTESIKESLLAINPNVVVETYPTKFNRKNAVNIIETYDIVIDATDNLMTRYMISDACVVAKKPLISGAALKMDGQLTVYNYDSDTPCFRCLFPEPPPPASVGSCSNNGVLGVIPGVIGVQQALEALKIGSGLKPAYAGKMLLFDGQFGLFRHIQLGKRKPDCQACGVNSKLSKDLIDYNEFCGQFECEGGVNNSTDILESNERISPEEYLNILKSKKAHVLIDVRPKAHSDVSRFSHALVIPVAKMLQNREETFQIIDKALKESNTNLIYVVCRKGIASQRGTRIVQDLFEAYDKDSNVIVKDIIGGMTGWAKNVDPDNYACL